MEYLVVVTCGVTVLLALAYFITRLRLAKNSPSKKSWQDELIDSYKQQNTADNLDSSVSVDENSSKDLRNQQLDSGIVDAWEERRRRGIAAASSHEKKDIADRKPFGSSYYYAHNNTKATGGYKDGLTMEDYTMNGPRLLSKGGKPVSTDNGQQKAVNQEITAVDTAKKAMSQSSSFASFDSGTRIIHISRYLWDDPGDSSGIATIRIDELPGKTSTDKYQAWKDVSSSITNITADLVDGGLILLLTTDNDIEYRLKIAKLYGEVTKVEYIRKAKRLLVKLQKKKGLLLGSGSNLKAWPHPQKKTA